MVHQLDTNLIKATTTAGEVWAHARQRPPPEHDGEQGQLRQLREMQTQTDAQLMAVARGDYMHKAHMSKISGPLGATSAHVQQITSFAPDTHRDSGSMLSEDDDNQPDDPGYTIGGAHGAHNLNWSSTSACLPRNGMDTFSLQANADGHAASITFSCGHCHTNGEVNTFEQYMHTNNNIDGLRNLSEQVPTPITYQTCTP